LRRKKKTVVRRRPLTVEERVLRDLVRKGEVAWSGGKPQGAKKPPRVKGPSVADAVIEDRQ
jgi:hypothetical protein